MPAYTTEYYTQNNDGTYSLNTSVVSYSGVSMGQTANANKTKEISGYAYSANANEVLSGTVGVQGLTLKVYYNQQLTYDREIYLWDTTEEAYVKSDGYSSTGLIGVAGATVTLGSLPDIDDYYYNPDVEGTVSSATLELNTSVVLKAYYVPLVEETIVGFRTAATLDVGTHVGTVSSYQLTQYIVKYSGNVGVDVTDKYSGLITEGIADTSRLDGIFKLAVFGDEGAYVCNFEQITEGTFVWNNIDETGAASVKGATVKGRYSREALTTSYTLTMENASSDTLLAGKSGNWYKATIAFVDSTEYKVPSLRVFPTHSSEYFNTLWLGATVSFNYVAYRADGAKTSTQIAVTQYINSNSGGSNRYPTTNTFASASFTINSYTFTNAIETRADTGCWAAFAGWHSNWSNIKGNPELQAGDIIGIYVGNITAVAAS